MDRHIQVVLATAVALAIMFFAFPFIDIKIASFFFTDKGGISSFATSEHSLLMLFLYNIPIIMISLISLFLLIECIGICKKNRSLHWKYYKVPIYIVLVCSIGPGFIVEQVIKNTFNRPRPFMVKEFGGDKIFAPAFVASDQCSKNCSFVSGHASAGFMLFAVAFVIKNQRNRRLMMLLAIFMGGVAGYGRMVLGKHFLSDIIFAGVIIYLVAYLLAIFFKLESVTGNNAKRGD